MKKHHRERLIRLADKLQGTGPYEAVGPVPIRQFDITTTMNDHNPNDCRFAACAVGWALTDPWFKRRKLSKRGLLWRGPVQEFFGISEPSTDHLFMPSRYIGKPRPATVAKRIRKFVEQQS